MDEPDTFASSRAWSWRHAIGKSGLPANTRHVLLTLSLKMDETGGSCYPPVSELVDLTGLDKKTVCKHLEIAAEKGWIEVSQHGFRGQRWKRNEYTARWPGRDLIGSAVEPETDEGGGAAPPPSQGRNTIEGGGAVPPPCRDKVGELSPKGGGNDAHKVGEQLPQDKILPANIPANLPAAAPAGGGLAKADRKKIETEFVGWFATWTRGGDIDMARNTWFSLSADERAACIQLTPAYLRFVKKSDLTVAATYLKARAWSDLPSHLLAPPEKKFGIAKVCGKLWMATRLAALLQPPSGVIVITAFDERQIASGKISREEILRSKRRDHGWPVVSHMRELAQRGEPFVCSLWLLPFCDDFRSVERGSPLHDAWRRYHERMGWSFSDVTTAHPWFPPVDETAPDLNAAIADAMADFRERIEGKGHEHGA